MTSGGEQLRVEPAALTATCQALSGAADHLRSQLKTLDGNVTSMLRQWRGDSGGSYSSAWTLWQQGADEVERSLAVMARLLGEAGTGFTAQDRAGRAELSGLCHG